MKGTTHSIEGYFHDCSTCKSNKPNSEQNLAQSEKICRTLNHVCRHKTYLISVGLKKNKFISKNALSGLPRSSPAILFEDTVVWEAAEVPAGPTTVVGMTTKSFDESIEARRSHDKNNVQEQGQHFVGHRCYECFVTPVELLLQIIIWISRLSTVTNSSSAAFVINHLLIIVWLLFSL